MKIRKIMFHLLVAFMFFFSFSLVTSNYCSAEGPDGDQSDEELVDGEFVADEEVSPPDNLCEKCEEGGEEEADTAEPAVYSPCVSVPQAVTIGCVIGGNVLCSSN